MLPSETNKMVAVLVVDMQENMWDGDVQRPKLMDKRERAMEALADDIESFTDDMRDYGAQIIWCLMDNDEQSDYGDLAFGLERHEGDAEIHKTQQWALPENEAFFEELQARAEAQGKDLEIKVCGVWALECIANTVVSLNKAGYDAKAVGDLIIDSAKPCMDDERPDFAEAHALHAMGEATGRGADIHEWADDIVRKQKAMAASSTPNAPGPN